MAQETLTAFFGWLTILHIGLFALSVILTMAMQDWAARLHGRMFGLAPADVSLTVYRWLGTYKIVIFATALGPWLALKLV